MRCDFAILGVVLALTAGCTVVKRAAPVSELEQCLKDCSGCCDDAGLCRDGASNFACGGRGTVCSACTGGEECRVFACRPVTGVTDPGPGSPAPASGDLTLRWSFDGQACAFVRDVSTVTVDLPGLELPNHGVFPCSSGAADGVTLSNLPSNTYRYNARALASDGRLLYQASGSLSVSGPTSRRIDLDPVATATGRALVRWQLPTSCQSAEVSHVEVLVDGAALHRASCTDGQLMALDLLHGWHTVELSAVDDGGLARLWGTGTVFVVAGAQSVVDLGLEWLGGGLAVAWQFNVHGVPLSCDQVAASTVYLNLGADDGHLVYPGAGVAVPCHDGDGAQGAVFPFLPAGRFSVFIQAVGAGGALFHSNFDAPVTGLVRAGEFPRLQPTTPQVTLTE